MSDTFQQIAEEISREEQSLARLLSKSYLGVLDPKKTTLEELCASHNHLVKFAAFLLDRLDTQKVIMIAHSECQHKHPASSTDNDNPIALKALLAVYRHFFDRLWNDLPPFAHPDAAANAKLVEHILALAVDQRFILADLISENPQGTFDEHIVPKSLDGCVDFSAKTS